jgi:hypothetical protein
LALQGLPDEGSFTSVSEIAEAEGSSISDFCRDLQLTVLAPDIVERTIVGGQLLARGSY